MNTADEINRVLVIIRMFAITKQCEYSRTNYDAHN